MWTVAIGIQCKEKKEKFNVYYKERWKFDLEYIEDRPQIYRVWSISNTSDVYFYGEYNQFTLLGNKEHAQLYKIYPSADNHVWYKYGIYFVASNMLWLYNYSNELNKIQCNSLDEGILKIKISNSYYQDFFHVSIKTLSLGYLCKIPDMLCFSDPYYRYNNISSIITVNSNRFIISGSDEYKCYNVVHHIEKKYWHHWTKDFIGKGKVIKSGGTFDPVQYVVHLIEQTDKIHLVQFYHRFDIVIAAYEMKDEIGQWSFSGFVEVRNSRLYSLLICNAKPMILIQKGIGLPIAFYTETLLNYTAGVNQNRFFLFSVSEDRFFFNVSNAPLSSIHSIENFELLDHYLMTNMTTFPYSTDIYDAFPQIIEFSKTEISELRNTKIIPYNLTDYSNINFNADDCHINNVYFNPRNIVLDITNWTIICSSDDEKIEYSLTYFENRGINLVHFDNSINPK